MVRSKCHPWLYKKTGGGGDKLPCRKGVGLLFFRVVNARYKDRQYAYLKLLESHRQGDKIKHKLLVSLSMANQLPVNKIKPLFDDLTKTIADYKEISELLPPSCRYLKTAYLLALENSFKVSQRTDRDFGEIIRADGKVKHNLAVENAFFDLILAKAGEYGLSPELFGWVENLEDRKNKKDIPACFLIDSAGFPLRFTHLSREKGEEISGLTDLKLNNLQPEFFLAQACERLYNNIQLSGLSKKEKGLVFKEVYVLKHINGWSGNVDFNMEKILIWGPEQALQDKKVNKALLAVTNAKNHLSYVSHRIVSATRGYPISAQDLMCTYFISLFFKKIFDEIIARHNI